MTTINDKTNTPEVSDELQKLAVELAFQHIRVLTIPRGKRGKVASRGEGNSQSNFLWVANLITGIFRRAKAPDLACPEQTRGNMPNDTD
ncbi:MAG: hypothetical protein EPO32_00945 [Anaerolineae bacterium]|nr:MAG: hypothetical protein EPO32_00945 [Anaerolineae bacterium]